MAGKFFGALCLVLSLASVARSACVGTSSANIPYSLSYTRTGDASSTNFLVLVCGNGCQGDAYCPDVTGITVGASGVSGGSGSDDCGVTFPVEMSAQSGCKTVSFAVGEPNASLDKVCGNGCQVKFSLSDGQSVVKTVDGNVVPAPEVVPSPSPEVVPSPSPEAIPSQSPDVVTSPDVVPNPSPSGQVIASNTPQPYGRRRISRFDAESRRLMQYGRRLNQYRRRLNQYGRRLSQYGSN